PELTRGMPDRSRPADGHGNPAVLAGSPCRLRRILCAAAGNLCTCGDVVSSWASTATGVSVNTQPIEPIRTHLRSQPYETIAVIGAGAWASALATVARRAGRTVRLWGRDAAVIDDINSHQRNERFLPGIDLAPGIVGTTDLAAALNGAQAVLIVIPSV